LTGFTDQGYAINLGNIATGNSPFFQVIGVGDNNTLYSYDLLQASGSLAPSPLVEGVFELHAVYGVSTNAAGTIDLWASPSTDVNYKMSALMDGSAAATQRLRNIKAVRVGLITRTSLPENCVPVPATGPAPAKPCSTGASLSPLFADLGALSYTRALADAERVYRYRVIEATIPLRNNMF